MYPPLLRTILPPTTVRTASVMMSVGVLVSYYALSSSLCSRRVKTTTAASLTISWLVSDGKLTYNFITSLLKYWCINLSWERIKMTYKFNIFVTFVCQVITTGLLSVKSFWTLHHPCASHQAENKDEIHAAKKMLKQKDSLFTVRPEHTDLHGIFPSICTSSSLSSSLWIAEAD